MRNTSSFGVKLIGGRAIVLMGWQFFFFQCGAGGSVWTVHMPCVHKHAHGLIHTELLWLK